MTEEMASLKQEATTQYFALESTMAAKLAKHNQHVTDLLDQARKEYTTVYAKLDKYFSTMHGGTSDQFEADVRARAATRQSWSNAQGCQVADLGGWLDTMKPTHAAALLTQDPEKHFQTIAIANKDLIPLWHKAAPLASEQAKNTLAELARLKTVVAAAEAAVRESDSMSDLLTLIFPLPNAGN